MDLYQNNIGGLAINQPAVAELLRGYRPPADPGVKVVATAGGGKTALVRGDNGHWYQVTSLYDPEAEAQKRYREIPFNHTLFLLVFGSGFGYPFPFIFTRKETEAFVVCVEPNAELIWHMFHHVDLLPLFRTNRFFILTGTPEEMKIQFLKIIVSTAIFYATRPKYLFLPQSAVDHVLTYREIAPRLIEQIRIQAFYVAGDIMDSMTGFEQSVFNLDEYLENPYFHLLMDHYRGKPVIVISTGPSLDKNIEELRRARGKAVILCAESAIVPLLARGIVPDAMMILERIYQTYEYHIKDRVFPEELVLFALMVVNTKVFDEWKGTKIPVFPWAEVHSNTIHELCGSPGNLYSGISASHMAFNMARFLGAGSIILVGQDLAYGDEGRSHSADSSYGDTRGKQDKDSDIVYVRDYNGNLIPSTDVWYRFIRWYETEISKISIPVIDATEGGAYIEGTKIMTLKDAIDTYCTEDVPPLYGEINTLKGTYKLSRLQKLEIIDRMKRWLKVMLEIHEEVFELTREKSETAIRNIDKLRNNTYSSVNDIVEDTLGNQKVFDFIKGNKYLSFMFQTHMMGMHFWGLEVGTVDTIEKLQQILEVHQNFFECVLNGEENCILPVIKNCIRRMEELGRYYEDHSED